MLHEDIMKGKMKDDGRHVSPFEESKQKTHVYKERRPTSKEKTGMTSKKLKDLRYKPMFHCALWIGGSAYDQTNADLKQGRI